MPPSETDLGILVSRMSEQIDLLSRQISEERVDRIASKNDLKEIQEKYNVLSKKIDDNTSLTQEALDIFAALKGGIRVMGWVGNLAKWVAGVAAAIGGLYVLWKKHWPGA